MPARPKRTHGARDPLLTWSFFVYASSISSFSISNFLLLAAAWSSCPPGCSFVNVRLYADKTAKREIHLAPCDVTAPRKSTRTFRLRKFQHFSCSTCMAHPLASLERIALWYRTSLTELLGQIAGHQPFRLRLLARLHVCRRRRAYLQPLPTVAVEKNRNPQPNPPKFKLLRTQITGVW